MILGICEAIIMYSTLLRSLPHWSSLVLKRAMRLKEARETLPEFKINPSQLVSGLGCGRPIMA